MYVESNFKTALDHVDSRRHLALKYGEMFNKFIEKYTKEACEEFADNNVAIRVNYNFICIPCQRNFNNFVSALEHIQYNKSHNTKIKNGIICDKIKHAIHSCENNFKTIINKVDIFDIKLVFEYLNAYQDYDSYINNEYNKYTLFEAFKTLYNYTNEDYKTLINNGVIIYEYFLPICRICNYISCTSEKMLDHIKEKHGKVIIKTQQKEDINNDKEKIQYEENVKNDTEKLQKEQNINNNNEEEKQQKYNINSNDEILLFRN
ncbi:unnamed protein product [Xylocopa violacea]|uniref:C2H2-type domain-containing protein n=1 Tax=Xylocopa violacea TaxID=135666 RepID=A0ABP1NQ49_XYLVO